jgi:hypothetical protein
MAEHKYIKREGTPGNYKYIYDVKNAFSGFGKGVAKAANTFGKNVASGTAQGFNSVKKNAVPAANNLRKDIKNAGSKLVMGANGAVEKVREAAESDIADKAYNSAAKTTEKILNNAGKAFSPEKFTNAAKSLKNLSSKVTNTLAKAVEKDQATSKGSEYLKKKDVIQSVPTSVMNNMAETKRKEADDAAEHAYGMVLGFNDKRLKKTPSAPRVTTIDLREYAKDKKFLNALRIIGEVDPDATDEEIIKHLNDDPDLTIPENMMDDFDRVLDAMHDASDKAEAAKKAEKVFGKAPNKKDKHKEEKPVVKVDISGRAY